MADLNLADLNVPAWLARTDAEQWLADRLTANLHAERWKYTASAKVLDLLDDQRWCDPVLPASVSAADTAAAAELVYRGDAPEAFVALCRAENATVVKVTESPGAPIKLSHEGSTRPIFLSVAPHVTLELVEEAPAEGAQAQLLWLALGEGSVVTHSRQAFVNAARHWQYLNVSQAAASTYTLHNHALGAQLRRQDIHVQLTGPGAAFELQSAAYVALGVHLDQQLTVEHLAGQTRSRQQVHNIGADKATVVCNGRIHIHRGAAGADAELVNRNLALGAQTAINSKPELEIYTDDVKCAHGATIGQLSDDQLYYCTSRGIDPGEARHLLSKGFLLEGVAGRCAESTGAVFAEALA